MNHEQQWKTHIQQRLDSLEKFFRETEERALIPHTVRTVETLIGNLKSFEDRVDTMADTFADMADYTGYAEFRADRKRAEQDFYGPSVEEMMVDCRTSEHSYSDQDVQSFRRVEVHIYAEPVNRVAAGGREYPDGHIILTWFDSLQTTAYENMEELDRAHGQREGVAIEYLD